MRTHKPVPVSLPEDLLKVLDARARALGLSRSAYVQQLIRRDTGLAGLADILPRPAAPAAGSQPASIPLQPPPAAAATNTRPASPAAKVPLPPSSSAPVTSRTPAPRKEAAATRKAVSRSKGKGKKSTRGTR